MSDFIIRWECPDNGHKNAIEVHLDLDEDADWEEALEDIYTDVSVSYGNPCKICGDIGFNEVETEKIEPKQA